jgi:predicted acetyltransferase
MAEPIYRPIPPDDYEQFVQNETEAFGGTAQRSREWMASDRGGDLRGLYLDGRLVAQLLLLPLEVQSGAGPLAFGGIGHVVSPPEARRRGYVDRLLRELAAELRERNIHLSILSPFKATFYSQFGWATFEEQRIYSGPPAAFAPFRKQRLGGFERVGDAQIADLDAIYREALRKRFGPLVRDARWWRRELLRTEKEDTYSFIWRDETGRGRSYVIYQWKARPAGNAMVCREAAALDPIARAQLFGFMADHDNQCAEVVFRGPADAPVQAVVTEHLGCEVRPHFQLRLLDVAAALESYRFPADVSGRLTLAVADDWLAYNQGVYELEIAAGTARCRRLTDDTAADLACDVRVLAQLYSRYLRPRAAAVFGLLEARERPAVALLERLFAGPAPFCPDHF